MHPRDDASAEKNNSSGKESLGTVNMNLPPGFRTLAVSESTLSSAGICSITQLLNTLEKDLSSKGRRHPSPSKR